MNNVTVRCGCGRAMAADGASGRGSFRCGCGARIVVTVTEVPQCVFRDESGRRCRGKPGREAIPLGLMACPDHFGSLGEWFDSLKVAETEREAMVEAAFRSMAESRGIREEWNAQRAERDATADWYVYYIRIGDRIKIGTTGAFKQRMAVLMPDEILAVEPGGQPLEHARHLQFKHLQIRGERFSPGEDLLSHIEMIREHYPELIGALPGYAAPQPT